MFDSTSNPYITRYKVQVLCVQEWTSGLKNIVDTIHASTRQWLEKWEKIIRGWRILDHKNLNMVFNKLYKNEFDTKTFIIKSLEVQKDKLSIFWRSMEGCPRQEVQSIRWISIMFMVMRVSWKKLSNKVPIQVVASR